MCITDIPGSDTLEGFCYIFFTDIVTHWNDFVCY